MTNKDKWRIVWTVIGTVLIVALGVAAIAVWRFSILVRNGWIYPD